MKVPKTTKKSFVTMEETWLDKIPLDGIPILTSIPKSAGIEKTSIKMMTRNKRMAEVIRDNDKRYKTMSDVFRAANYIGISILYRYSQVNGNDGAYGEATYQIMKRNEKDHMRGQLMDDVLTEVDNLLKLADRGHLTPRELKDHIDEIMDSLPDDCYKLVKEKIMRLKSLRSGGKGTVSELFVNRIARIGNSEE